MKRIAYLSIYTFIFILISTSICHAQSANKPNVIFILADDLGYGDVGVYGQKLIRTPNINALAKSGMKFTQFYTGSPVCAPSRSALMTGQHTGHTPICGNKAMKPEGQSPLPAAAFTIAELFKKAGYTTGDFGKWGLGFVGTEGDPNKQGFDRFFGYNCQSLAHNYYPDHLWDNDKRIDLPNAPGKPQVYSASLIQKEALGFIEANSKKPFFLYLSYTLPHAGLQVPPNDTVFQNYREQFGEEARPVKSGVATGSYIHQPYPHAAYAAMVTRLDTYVGQVVATLKSLRIDKNTLIIFTSDNGPHKEGGNEPQFFNSNRGFKGLKRDVYEGGIRAPMIACWPAVVKPGSLSHHIGAFWDFLPLFAEITAQPKPQNIDGISFLPALQATDKQQPHKYLYWEFHEEGGKQAVRMGKWKGVRLNTMKAENSPIELYDLEADPKETTDIAGKNSAVVAEIKNLMQDAHKENTTFPFTATASVKND